MGDEVKAARGSVPVEIGDWPCDLAPHLLSARRPNVTRAIARIRSSRRGACRGVFGSGKLRIWKNRCPASVALADPPVPLFDAYPGSLPLD